MRLSSSSTSRMRRCKDGWSGMLRNLRRRHRRGAGRKTEREDGTTFAPPVDGHVAAVSNSDLLDDRQPEAAAAYTIGPASAIERLKKMRQVARGNAWPAIFAGDDDAA